MQNNYAHTIAANLNIPTQQVQAVLWLLHNGATIPFIARYRKDQTSGADEILIAKIFDLEQELIKIDQRRNYILQTIQNQNKLTPQLKSKILSAKSLQELEDLFLPFKPNRKTRASKALQAGLKPLALTILQQHNINPVELAHKFISDKFPTPNDAIQGARDIIADIINTDAQLRKKLADLFRNHAIAYANVIKSKQNQALKYKDYFDFQKPAKKLKSHQILALFSAEKQGLIRLKIYPDKNLAIKLIQQKYIKADNPCSKQVSLAINDAYSRLLQPAMENLLRAELKEFADSQAISVFEQNLKHLLMEPPLGPQNIIAIDPGFKTGCKIAVLDQHGNLLHHDVIYPHSEPKLAWQAAQQLTLWTKQFNIQAIALGNGTASRETRDFLRKIRFPHPVKIFLVDESGASIYSASEIAREEFPEYDITVRGAVSIGRRLLDPLAELVKIDPKSLGIGQYQHDVNQKKLKLALDRTVINVVNNVGVNLNTASKYLLQYVSGIGPSLAEKIIQYRKKIGKFSNRNQLLQIPGLGPKIFQQAAGFLRIKNGDNPLDATAIHPETYYIVEKIASDLNLSVNDLFHNKQALSKIDKTKYYDNLVGPKIFDDILTELLNPGTDPRDKIKQIEFDPNIKSIYDLKPGMILPGIITNVAKFGAFVDIGIKQNGLIHISELADHFISDPNQIVHLHQIVRVKILNIDLERSRISLSLKQANQTQNTQQ